MRHPRYASVLLALLAVWWTALAIEPLDRHAWMLENALLVLAVVVLVATYRRFPLSRISYAVIFLFLCLHTLGAHYTYADVPYDRWWASLTGVTFNEWVGWERNNFDRVVHFSYGLLACLPDPGAFSAHRGGARFLGLLLAARLDDVYVRAVRAP